MWWYVFMFFIILLIVGKSIFHKKSLVFENPSTPFLSIITTTIKLDLKLYTLLFFIILHLVRICFLWHHNIHVTRTVMDWWYVDTFFQWLAIGQWFSPGPPPSCTNKSERHDITEILLKWRYTPSSKRCHWLAITWS
jgi:hypothetical protein